LKIQALTLELAHHKRMRFGHKAERFSPEQRELFEESATADLAAIGAELEALAPKPTVPRAARPRGRQTLPAELPRIEHRHEPESCTCGQCGAHLSLIGEDVSEQLDVEPARFFVHRHIRPQYACRSCETVRAAPLPPAVIEGSLAAPGLLAWVVTQKYLGPLPLYRVEAISARNGVALARSTLAAWVGRIGVAVAPLAQRLAEHLKARAVLHADETPVPQLDPGRGSTRRATLWAYSNNRLAQGPPIVVFDYQPTRGGQHAQDFLAGWRGTLMVDDYVGYKALFAGGEVIELACWAHARRKFFDLQAAQPHPRAALALAKIGELYAIERDARALSSQARAALRQAEAQPRLAALYSWLLDTRSAVAPGSGMAKAIDYTLKRWAALVRYAGSGELPIDNNPIENAIRPIALGKKNWLFAGSERAGQRAAAIQSLLATAQLNGIEPYAWLKATLEKLPTWPHRRLDELLPLRRSTPQ
ncbi:MAG: IS66 family transposase, partial [Burkholderiales bacterium]